MFSSGLQWNIVIYQILKNSWSFHDVHNETNRVEAIQKISKLLTEFQKEFERKDSSAGLSSHQMDFCALKNIIYVRHNDSDAHLWSSSLLRQYMFHWSLKRCIAELRFWNVWVLNWLLNIILYSIKNKISEVSKRINYWFELYPVLVASLNIKT